MSRNATATRSPRPRPALEADPPAVAPERRAPSVTLDLPLVTTTVRTPQFAVPAVETVAQAARRHMPWRQSALFYAGLAGTAAVGLISWPVAAAVGIGTALAQRDQR